MTDWTYFTGSKASIESALDVVRRFGVLWRGSRGRGGALIPNVGRLAAGDTLHLAHRGPGGTRYLLKGVIGPAATPAPGAPAIDRLTGAAADELRRAGYPGLDDVTMEVIHLGSVEEIEGAPLVQPPPSQSALWAGSPVFVEGMQATLPGPRGATAT